MVNPDALTRTYALILPELKQLGYRAALKPGYDDEICVLTVSRQPTTRVLLDGSWERDDGQWGESPADLVNLYRQERAHLLSHALETGNTRELATLLLALTVSPSCVATAATWDGDALDVEYRQHTALIQSTRLSHAKQQASTIIDELSEGETNG